ncbi:Endothelin-converting enzyme 2 [Phlyctochytrium bullatum]|nr:Endothelin-converting enzyme 2 [Phlyctochytrium bullatum]
MATTGDAVVDDAPDAVWGNTPAAAPASINERSATPGVARSVSFSTPEAEDNEPLPQGPSEPKESTPLLRSTSSASSQSGEPGFIDRIRGTITRSLEGTQRQIEADFGPGWRQLVNSAETSREASTSWFRRQWNDIQEAFVLGWNHVLDGWDAFFGYVDANHTIEQKNLGCLGLGIAVFLLFLWIYGAVMVLNPIPVEPNLPEPQLPSEPIFTPHPPVPPTPSPSPEPEQAFLCTSADCVHISASILSSIDRSIDPCGDFYQYSCGGFLKSNPITEAGESISVYSLLQDKVDADIDKILKDRSLRTKSPNAALLTSAQSFFASCLDTAAISQRGVKPLTDFLTDRISSEFPVVVPIFPGGGKKLEKDRLVRVLVESHSVGTAALFAFHVEPAHGLWPNNVPALTPAGHLGLDKDAYLDNDVVTAYKAVVAKALEKVVGGTGALTRKLSFLQLADLAVEFEAKLAAITPSRFDLIHTFNTSISIADLAAAAPAIPWESYITRRLESISIRNASANKTAIAAIARCTYGPCLRVTSGLTYFANLSALIETTAPNVLETYFLWQNVLELMPLVGEELVKEARGLAGKLRGVRKEEGGRDGFCKKLTLNYLGDLVSGLFDEYALDDRTHSTTAHAIQRIRLAFLDRLPHYTYLSEENPHMEAVSKIESARVALGSEPLVSNATVLTAKYAGIDFEALPLFEAAVRVREAADDVNLDRISGLAFRGVEEAFAYQIRPMMSVPQNRLFVPAGALHFPFRSQLVPSYVFYGAIATRLAGRLFHTIDTTGRYYDYSGAQLDWFTPRSAAIFEDRSKCYADQLSSQPPISFPNGTAVPLKGEHMKLAAAAYHQGLEVALDAWKAQRVAVGGGASNPVLPALEGYTQEQLFFISYAMRECGSRTPQELARMAAGRHPPPRARVNLAVANSKAFAKAFKCWRDTPMNPVDKCQL